MQALMKNEKIEVDVSERIINASRKNITHLQNGIAK